MGGQTALMGAAMKGKDPCLDVLLAGGWADLGEAPVFWSISGPLGPAAGPGSPGNGSGSKDSAG